MDSSEKKYRYRKSDVCAVCRRRKIRCDRVKPCCGNCKKSNQMHLCRYDTLPVLVVDDKRSRSPSSKSLASFGIRKPVVNNIESGQKLRLQQQNQEFQQELIQKQQYQQFLQAQMAAKYAPQGGVPMELQGALPLQFQQPPVQQYPSIAPFQQYQPNSYNVEQNLKAEYDDLKARLDQIETQLPELKTQQAPLYPPQAQPQIRLTAVDDISRTSTATIVNGDKTANTSLLDQEDDRRNVYIDPAFFEEGDYLKYVPVAGLSDLLKNQDGLFKDAGILTNDQYFALLYLNLANNIDEAADSFDSLKSGKKKLSKKDIHLISLLNRGNYEIEDTLRLENVNLLSIIKAIEKSHFLISKRVFWSYLDKFFEKFQDGFLPLSLQKESFYKAIEPIVGAKEIIEQKIKFNIDIKSNEDLVNFSLIAFIFRVFQICLKSYFHTDKDTSALFKQLLSDTNNEIELHFQLLFLILSKFNLTNEQTLKLQIIQQFLGDHSFEPFPAPSLETEKLILKNQVESNTDIWAFLAKDYLSTNTINGSPFLLNIDHFKISQSHEYIKDIFNISSKIINKLNNHVASPVHLSTIEKTLFELHELLTKHNLHFNEFKSQTTLAPLEKITKTLLNLDQLYIQSNVVGLINLFLDKNDNVNNDQYLNKILCHFDLINQGNSVSLDILKNYNSYFQPGYEFLLIPKILTILSNNVNLLLSYLTRFYQSLETLDLSLEILKFYCNMIEELENHPVLKNYFATWKVVNKLKTILYLFKSNNSEKGFKLFKNDGVVQNFQISKILSNGIIIGMGEVPAKNKALIFGKLALFNSQFFENDVSKSNNLNEFLEAVKFSEEPELSLSFIN